MDVQKLVKMANEIGKFFEAQPDHTAAVEGVASHISRFWEPRMRRELLVYVEQTGGTDLRPLVLEAVKSNRYRLTPKAS